jgi:orotidine-5'-phosphate decarboxylase
MTTTSPVFCALDRPDLEGTLALARQLAGAVGGLKLGLEFVSANGPAGVRAVAALGLPIFLDLKLHDIPNTVAGAIRALAPLEVRMLTLHASGGAAMLKAAVAAARELPQRPWLLGVTVLTSLDQADLAAQGIAGTPQDQALRLAGLAHDCGLDGIVCAPQEIEAIRARFGHALRLVVPGIRPATAAADDQKRTMSPADAIQAGADYLVVGRPITAAADPAAAAHAIAAEIATAQSVAAGAA